MKVVVLAVLFCFWAGFLTAQTTAVEIETLLNTNAVTYAQAARLVLEASEVTVTADTAEAFQYAADRKWLPKKASANETARLDGIALLVMRSFDIKGGLFYSLSRSPHYAYRELVYKQIILGRTDPAMAVSGDNFLYILNRVLSIKEAEVHTQVLKEEERLAKEINEQLAAHHVADTRATVTSEGVTISLSNIQFRANSSELLESEMAKIREIAGILENVSERNLLIAGHTAMAGTWDEQQRTSRERAQAVANYLVSLGVRTTQEITVQGYGADRPVAGNDTEAGMAQNRRVEITILYIDSTERGRR
ncbi:MAG: OmpA family protein [Treponema sp.]|nr:OmpA family protein [Treponema sp.]